LEEDMKDDLHHTIDRLAELFPNGELALIYDMVAEMERLRKQHCCTIMEAPESAERWKCRVCGGRLVPVEHVEKLRAALAAWVKWEANPDGAPDSGWFAQAQDLAERSRELLEGKVDRGQLAKDPRRARRDRARGRDH